MEAIHTATSPSAATESVTQTAEAPLHQHSSSRYRSKTWTTAIYHLTPAWFTVTMGTGIVPILLVAIPWPTDWLFYLSLPWLMLNIILFSALLLASILQYTIWPETWTSMIQNPQASLFLGSAPIGFATIIEMLVLGLSADAHWGQWVVIFAWICWMIDTIASVLVTLMLCLILVRSSKIHELKQITAVQLMPIAATVVAAGTGAEVAGALSNTQHALGTLITSYVLWGISMPLAITVLAMYYQRLMTQKIPPSEVVVSCFIPVAPLGFGGYGIMAMGKVARELFPATSTLAPASAIAGDVLYVLGWAVGLVMWSWGLVWLTLAVWSLWIRRPLRFNLGWWAFTFPLGVYALSTIEIGNEIPSTVFKVFGTIAAVVVILMWTVVFTATARGVWKGELLRAPRISSTQPVAIDSDTNTAAKQGPQST